MLVVVAINNKAELMIMGQMVNLHARGFAETCLYKYNSYNRPIYKKNVLWKRKFLTLENKYVQCNYSLCVIISATTAGTLTAHSLAM